MLIKYDFESNIFLNMPKHSDRSAGDDDIPVMRYERRTVDVGSLPRTGFAIDDCVEPSGCCVGMSCDDGRATLLRAL
jgi:hypothetical protein